MNAEEKQLIFNHNTTPFKPTADDLMDPRWKMGNHPILLGLTERARRELRYQHALHPCPDSKKLVCPHEVAHAVIIGWDGSNIVDVIVWPNGGGGWAGEVLHNPPFHAPSRSANPDLWLMREAVYLISGYAGEIFSGYAHAMSSLPERVAAIEICLFLDEKLGKNQGYLYGRALSYCVAVLAANNRVFQTMCGEMLHRGRITGKQVRRIMKKSAAHTQQLSLEAFITENALLAQGANASIGVSANHVCAVQK